MSREPVPAERYDTAYFLSECEGHDVYLRSGGEELPPRLVAALELAGALAGLRILDLGCGRGEIVRHSLHRGARAVGLDYSPEALALARRILPAEAALIRADVARLPFADETFDLVFALDLVEHLQPPQWATTLAEVRRVLRPGGRLVIHTMPNIWYYRYGYPLFRVVQRLRGRRLPRDPRERWHYVQHVHVNEQSVASLSRSLQQAGLRARVWLRNLQGFSQEANPFMRRVMRFMAETWPLVYIFCNDICAVATKEPASGRGAPAGGKRP